MQGEFENLCFVAVLMKKQKLWLFVHVMLKRDAEMAVRNRSFFMDFILVCGEAR